MIINKRNFILAIILFIMAIFMGVDIPHMNISLSGLILPDRIINKGVKLTYDGILIWMVLFASCIFLIKSLAKKSKSFYIVIFIAVIILYSFSDECINKIMPVYYEGFDNFKSLNALEGGYSFRYTEEDTVSKVSIYNRIINYGESTLEFKIRLILPKELTDRGFSKTVSIPDSFKVRGKDELIINRTYEIEEFRDIAKESIDDIPIYYLDYDIELYNEVDSLVIRINK